MANVYNRRIIKDKQKLHEQKVLEQREEIGLGFRSANEKRGRTKAAIKRSKRNSAIMIKQCLIEKSESADKALKTRNVSPASIRRLHKAMARWHSKDAV